MIAFAKELHRRMATGRKLRECVKLACYAQWASRSPLEARSKLWWRAFLWCPA